MSNKVAFAQQIQSLSKTLDATIDQTDDIVKTYFDRGFNSGGADPITDADLSSLGVTASLVASFITLSQQLANFRSNQAVLQGDYQSTLNKLRTDI